MPDRTAEVEQFIRESYPAFEFIPIRLSNAFDKRWWKTIRGGPLAKSDFALRFDLGEVVLTCHSSGSDAHFRRSCIRTLGQRLSPSARIAPNILPLTADPNRCSFEYPNAYSGAASAYRTLGKLVSRFAGDILDLVGDFTHIGDFQRRWV